MVGREGGGNRKRPPEPKAIKGGCASTRGHSANLECSFEVRGGQIWVLNRKVKYARGPEPKATKGGCASTRGHSANLEYSFGESEG